MSWSSRKISQRNQIPADADLDESGRHFAGGSSDAAASSLRWRNVTYLAADPDQPPSPRLQLFAQAGIGYAAGMQFNVRGHRGIVVFMARKTVDMNRLMGASNVAHLTAAADLIGSICAFERPREVCRSERAHEKEETKRRIRAKIMAVNAFGTLRFSSVREPEEVEEGHGLMRRGSVFWRKAIRRRSLDRISGIAAKTKASIVRKTLAGNLRVWLRKCCGSDVRPPPPMHWNQALWTFFGSFVVFLLWSLIVDGVEDPNNNLRMMRGSFGSLVAAQFTLMAAPASQPRNAFLSEVLAGIISISINYINVFPRWFRTSISPSLHVAVMAKLGVTHPTSGGDALLYASTGEEASQWQMYGFVLFNYAFAIVMATIINNLSRRRQYPIYWGYAYNYLQRRFRGTNSRSRRG